METLRALGRAPAYPDRLDLGLLEPLPRALGRAARAGPVPSAGLDLWRAHELCWYRPDGRPEVALAHLTFPADSPRLIESKSLKLALGSLNFAAFPSPQAVAELLRGHLEAAVGAPVTVALFGPQRPPPPSPHLAGICLDEGAVPEISEHPDAGTLAVAAGQDVEQTLYTHLFRSVCPVTGQPDWATVVIHYRGRPLSRVGLLAYLLSFRRHPGFHEALVEQVFADIRARCQPTFLTVFALFTCRGGIDINPLRTTGAPHCPLRSTYRRPPGQQMGVP